MGENSGDWGERAENGVRAGENKVKGVRIPTMVHCVLPICCNGRIETPEGTILVCH
jgi:hypothetical protein